MKSSLGGSIAAVLLGLALSAGAVGPGREGRLDLEGAAAAAAESRALLAEARASYRAFELPAALERLAAIRARWILACPVLDRELASAPALLEGQVLFAAGERGRAVEAFGRALAADPALSPDPREWSPKLVAAFAEARADLLARPAARLALSGLPAGSDVTVDGRSLGAATGALELPPGDHCLLLRAPGHLPRALGVRLAAGEQRALALALRPEALAAPEDGPAPPALLPPPAAAVSPGDPQPPAPPPPEMVEPSWYERWWVWALVVVVVGGATVAGTLLAPGEGDPGIQVVITRPPR